MNRNIINDQVAVNATQRKRRSTMRKTMMVTMFLLTIAMAVFVGTTLASLEMSYFSENENIAAVPLASEAVLSIVFILLIFADSGAYLYGKVKSFLALWAVEKKNSTVSETVLPGENSFQDSLLTGTRPECC